MSLGEYFGAIRRTASTVFEGMAVTFSHLFREPITVQYPDRMERPLPEMLPMRYRGLLEVQMDICTGCKRCEKACPIDCIAIDLDKRDMGGPKKETGMSRFDIDMGKCMYCGLCVEACVAESTGAIRHTREFEAAAATLDGLLFRFVNEGAFVPLYKPPKDKSYIPVGEYGPHAREARERALRDNPGRLEALRQKWFAERRKKRTGALTPARKKGLDEARLEELRGALLKVVPEGASGGDEGVREGVARFLETLTARTDCEACGYPTCIAYTRALVSGADANPAKCEPAGEVATRELDASVAMFLGKNMVTDPRRSPWLREPAPKPATEPEAAPPPISPAEGSSGETS